MNEREKIIRLWFDMWLQKKDLGISEMFADNFCLGAFTGTRCT